MPNICDTLYIVLELYYMYWMVIFVYPASMFEPCHIRRVCRLFTASRLFSLGMIKSIHSWHDVYTAVFTCYSLGVIILHNMWQFSPQENFHQFWQCISLANIFSGNFFGVLSMYVLIHPLLCAVNELNLVKFLLLYKV